MKKATPTSRGIERATQVIMLSGLLGMLGCAVEHDDTFHRSVSVAVTVSADAETTAAIGVARWEIRHFSRSHDFDIVGLDDKHEIAGFRITGSEKMPTTLSEMSLLFSERDALEVESRLRADFGRFAAQHGALPSDRTIVASHYYNPSDPTSCYEATAATGAAVIACVGSVFACPFVSYYYYIELHTCIPQQQLPPG
jgi:hypothetical protein